MDRDHIPPRGVGDTLLLVFLLALVIVPNSWHFLIHRHITSFLCLKVLLAGTLPVSVSHAEKDTICTRTLG